MSHRGRERQTGAGEKGGQRCVPAPLLISPLVSLDLTSETGPSPVGILGIVAAPVPGPTFSIGVHAGGVETSTGRRQVQRKPGQVWTDSWPLCSTPNLVQSFHKPHCKMTLQIMSLNCLDLTHGAVAAILYFQLHPAVRTSEQENS